jgi:protein-L-isoaspartate(D-aspartate) O-methyltransferase
MAPTQKQAETLSQTTLTLQRASTDPMQRELDWVALSPCGAPVHDDISPLILSGFCPPLVEKSEPAVMTDYAVARLAMVNSQIRPSDVTDHRIQDAMGEIQRELFVPKSMLAKAYADTEVELSDGRTMLRPVHLAKLIQAADIRSSDVVLDMAFGRGYSTAVLARLAETVVGLEQDGAGFAAKAGERLAEIGANNAVVVEGDLKTGVPGQGPFDVIFVNGAVAKAPSVWFEQLADGGRLAVIERDGPVGRARIYTKARGHVGERAVFEAAPPYLGGFEPEGGFVF